jgi:hypothetical protein
MSPARTSGRERRERARRRAERLEMLRFAEALQRRARADLAELERLRWPALADAGVVLEARVEGDQVIVDAAAGSPAPTRRRT